MAALRGGSGSGKRQIGHIHSCMTELPKLVGKIKFDKTMRWNSSKIAFSRPIRWFLAII